MPEFLTQDQPPVISADKPVPKPFKEQSIEERYRFLIQRLGEKLRGWTIWADDLRTAAQVEEGNENRGKAHGLRAKANAISDCQKAILPYIERHEKALT